MHQLHKVDLWFLHLVYCHLLQKPTHAHAQIKVTENKDLGWVSKVDSNSPMTNCSQHPWDSVSHNGPSCFHTRRKTAVCLPSTVYLHGDRWLCWRELWFCPDVAEWSACPPCAHLDTSPEPAGATKTMVLVHKNKRCFIFALFSLFVCCVWPLATMHTWFRGKYMK